MSEKTNEYGDSLNEYKNKLNALEMIRERFRRISREIDYALESEEWLRAIIEMKKLNGLIKELQRQADQTRVAKEAFVLLEEE